MPQKGDAHMSQAAQTATNPKANLLAGETSPYLLQHKDNPVHWRPWGDAAFAEAQALDKPILLSVGYASCHWCHVMAHESFENPEIAALMNELFVNIKLDREERPDIDQVYQAALGMMGQQGGWPLTMFLTPAGEPYYAGTYFPPEDRQGRVGFPKVLTDIAKAYREQKDKVATTTSSIRQRLEELWSKQAAGQVDPNILDPVTRRLAQRIDLFFGGMEGSPKFPVPMTLDLLWRAYIRTAQPPFGQAVVTSLDNMCQGGLFDHLDGGFFRYSTDERWLVPHFEKMLYDNAQLIDLMTLVWQHNRAPLYATRVAETAQWLLREMVTKDGAFAASMDADSEGEEGKFYVWTEGEIDHVLGADAPLFKRTYGVTSAGNWEGRTILHRLLAMAFLAPDQEAILQRCRLALLKARDRRTHPNRDDKALADWNGMMIHALANAGVVFKQPQWIAAATRAFDVIVEKLGEGDRLWHSFRDGKRTGKGTLDDYAFMARAALTLFEHSSDKKYLDLAKRWVKTLNAHFWHKENGGYYFTGDDVTDIMVRARTAVDSATPNGNGIMLQVLGRLWHIAGDGEARGRANAVIEAFHSETQRANLVMAAYFAGLEFTIMPLQIVFTGDPKDPIYAQMVRAVLERSVPNRVMIHAAQGVKLHAGHPAFGKEPIDGKPTVYICSGNSCAPPITDVQTMARAMVPRGFALPQ